MISAKSVGLNAWGTPSITALGGMIWACDAWSMQPSSASCGAVLTRPSISPVTANSTWYCSLQPAPAVHHPERAAGGGHRRHGPVQELDVELVRLDVRFRQVGDLGHQLADLILRLLEQTRINGFFRHGGTSGMSPGSRVASPRKPSSSSGDQQRTGTVNTRHPLRNHNGTSQLQDFLSIFCAQQKTAVFTYFRGRKALCPIRLFSPVSGFPTRSPHGARSPSLGAGL